MHSDLLQTSPHPIALHHPQRQRNHQTTSRRISQAVGTDSQRCQTNNFSLVSSFAFLQNGKKRLLQRHSRVSIRCSRSSDSKGNAITKRQSSFESSKRVCSLHPSCHFPTFLVPPRNILRRRSSMRDGRRFSRRIRIAIAFRHVSVENRCV